MIYLLLAALGLIGAALTIAYSADRGPLVVFFVVAFAVISIADWIAYGWFDLFSYHPGLLVDPLADSSLGEFLADIFYVPCLCVVLVRYLPGLPGILTGSLTVTLLERLFLHLGVFSHHGWENWHTLAAFIVFYATIDLLWFDLRRGTIPHANLLALVRFCLVLDIVGEWGLFIRGSQLAVTRLHLGHSYAADLAIVNLLTYGLITVPLGFWALCAVGRTRWQRIGLVALCGTLVKLVMRDLGWQQFVSPMTPVLDGLAQGAAVALAALLEGPLLAAVPGRERLG